MKKAKFSDLQAMTPRQQLQYLAEAKRCYIKMRETRDADGNFITRYMVTVRGLVITKGGKNPIDFPCKPSALNYGKSFLKEKQIEARAKGLIK